MIIKNQGYFAANIPSIFMFQTDENIFLTEQMLKTKNYARFLWLLPLLIFIAEKTTAQNEKTQTQKDSTELSGKIEEVTVTAFRTPYNLLNTPAPVNLISAIQLETGSSFTPVEALNQVPGIVMHHGTLNTNRLTIRGIGSRTPYATNKIKAYFGEIPLTSGDGETTLEDLENAAIKRVEIIKGPSSSLFGAGLGGVILFHPKTVAKNFAENQTTVASFGTVKNTLAAGVIQNKLNIFALGAYLQSDGFRENNNTKRNNLLLHSQYTFSPNINLQVLLKATKMKAFIPSSIDLTAFESHPEQAASNWKNVKGYEDYLSGQFGVSLNIFTNRNEKISVATFGNFRDAEELRPFNTLDENSRYLGWRGYIQKNILSEHANITFTSGLEFFREKYNWATLSNDNPEIILSDNAEKRSYENLFFQMEAGFKERLFISAGINGNLTRFDYSDQYTENGDQSGNHSYKPVLSPRLGFNFLILPQLSAFGNVSHGFSTPSFEETLLPEGEINPDIKPEDGWNFEVGFRTYFSEQLQLSMSYYRIYIRNLLVARRTGEDAYIGVNAGESLHPGLETEIKWSVWSTGNYPSLILSGNATVANYHFTDFVDNGVDYSNKNLPGTAKNTWLLSSSFSPAKNYQINVWYRHTGEMAVNDANTGFTKPYGITNGEVKYSGKIKKLLMEIKGGVQNIFDLNYAAMLAVNAPSFGGNLPRYYYPGNPRNFYFSVLLRLE
jgi:iron complex outermembrane receptor protein